MTRYRHVALTAAVLVLLALPSAVAGHSEFVSGTPKNGATVQPGPIDIVGTYSEALEPNSSMQLRDASGKVIARGAVDGKTMRIGLERIEPGEYEVRWVSVAADGDILRSTDNPDWKWEFTVAAASPSPPSAAPSPSAPASASPSAVVTPAPSASAPPGTTTGSSSGDVLLPIVAALVVVALLGGLLLRRRTPTAR
jgi:methionine-rich copper-binding protein CopC